MTTLYDEAIQIYKSKKCHPVTSTAIDQEGHIIEVVFHDVPVRVMSELFLFLERHKKGLKCGYSLEYNLTRDSEEIKRTFRIQKDPRG